MVVTIPSLKDATLYEYYTNRNTGMDQILELGYEYDYSSARRIIMKFDLNEIRSIVNGQTSPEYKLRLYTSEQYEVPEEYTIKIYPLSQTWDMGVGKFYDLPETTSGVSWQYRSGTNEWMFISGSTTYYIENSYASGGGSWNTTLSGSLDLNYETDDLNIDISDIVNAWLNNTIGNFGLIIKIDDEYNLNENVDLKYYSKETHTIYEPKLFINYDDTEFLSGSLEALTDKDVTIGIKNLRDTYYQNDTVRLYLHAREKYLRRTYSQTNPYLTSKYLPQTTHYSIIDGSSKTTIIPFSDYTTVNLNTTDGNYIDIRMGNFEPERYYKIIFKIVWGTVQQIYDNNLYFKVIQ